MKQKVRPFYRSKYQFELAESITGKGRRALQARMRRGKLDLAQVIKKILKVSKVSNE